MTAGNFGNRDGFSSVIVGITNGKQSVAVLYRGSINGLSLVGSYALPGPVTSLSMEDADLDDDGHPDGKPSPDYS